MSLLQDVMAEVVCGRVQRSGSYWLICTLGSAASYYCHGCEVCISVLYNSPAPPVSIMLEARNVGKVYKWVLCVVII